jgi:diphthine-ammonia ligase
MVRNEINLHVIPHSIQLHFILLFILDIIQQYSLKLNDLCYITLYVRNISDYTVLNEVYSKKLNFQNPPTRVCVECSLPEKCHVVLEAVAFKSGIYMANEADYRRTMHVQGISHWSPANIGPYSQATSIGDITYISGQIGLVPGNMAIVNGNFFIILLWTNNLKTLCQTNLRWNKERM